MSTARLAATALRVPYVSTRHNDDRYLLGPFRYVDRAFARPARRLIAISDAVRRFLERAGHAPEKLVTVHYGLDALPATHRPRSTPEAAGIPTASRSLLAVGRLIAQKDHATLLRAFARIRERTSGCAARDPGQRAAGSGDARARARARRWTTPSSSPAGQEPGDWLARADVFVHTSRWEGSGSSCSRRCSPRLPIVATSVSAVPEVVVDGETGLLVERRRRRRARRSAGRAARRSGARAPPRRRPGSGEHGTSSRSRG